MGAGVNGAQTACGGGRIIRNMGSGFYAAPRIFVIPDKIPAESAALRYARPGWYNIGTPKG